MKIKNIFMLFGALLFSAALLTSCSDDDDNYDVYGIDHERVYQTNATVDLNGAVVVTPVGTMTSLSAPLTVRTTKAPTTDLHVTLALDESYVEKYNEANGTSYKAVPSGAVTLSKSSLTILADTTASVDTAYVEFTDQAAELLNDKSGYVIPVVVASTDQSNYQPARDLNVRYIVLLVTEKSIRPNGTANEMLGTEISDYSTWTSDPTGFQSLFSGSSWSRRYSLGSQTSTFTLDMQEVKNITGFAIKGMYASWYPLQYISVSISSDGANWTDLGALESDEIYTDGDGYAWVDFYGAMKCRYLKITVTFAMSYSYYCSLQGFKAFEQ